MLTARRRRSSWAVAASVVAHLGVLTAVVLQHPTLTIPTEPSGPPQILFSASEERAALTLCYALGHSHGEAAEILKLPLGTVKSHVLRGREKLKAMLDG